MKKDKEVTFPDEGVKVKIPEQKSKVKVKVKKLKPGKITDCQKVSGKFTPKRYVIKIDFFDEEDPEKKVPSFDPRVEIRVRYRKKDVENAQGDVNNLRLGYCSGKGKEWQYFEEEKHDFDLVPDDKDPMKGEGVVKIRNWEDPAISWGH